MDLPERLARFAPVALTADPKSLDERQHALVRHLVAAGRQVEEIYLRQIWAGNPALRERLASLGDEEDRLRLRLFDLMGGPWDRQDGYRPFIGDKPRPAGAGFYPEDLTRAELDAWIERHPDDQAALTGYFTVVRREGGELKAVPYHEAYREWLDPAAEALEEAAGLSTHTPLTDYLRLRAHALRDDDYYDSDCAWVALQDGPIETVIGPYEVYDDQLAGFKAAYECMVGVRDQAESDRFHALVDSLPTIAAHLPVPPQYQGSVAGLASPIVVTDVVYASGQLSKPAIATAYVLPNDPRVRTTVGSKKVMLRNVARAKFEKIFLPVSQAPLDPDQLASVLFDVYFSFVLLHEVSHVLGARLVPQPDGTALPVHKALRELYSPIEECKADTVGLYNLLFLAGERFFPEEWREAAPAVHLAGILRMVRTGTAGAHAQGELLAFNFLWEEGAIHQDRQTGRLRVDLHSFPPALARLAELLLRIEGDGDYGRARALLDRYARVRPELRRALDLVPGDLPLDLAPSYPWGEGAAE